MVINERFSIDRIPRNWVLQEITHSTATKGKNKGKTVERVQETFYGNLQSLCLHCIDKSLDPEGGFKGMLEQLERVNSDLSRMIKKQGISTRQVIKEAAK